MYLRYKALQGYNVYTHGLGCIWYAAENAARDNKLDPKDWTNKNIKTMKNQQKLGLSIDWNKYLLVPKNNKHQQMFFWNS